MSSHKPVPASPRAPGREGPVPPARSLAAALRRLHGSLSREERGALPPLRPEPSNAFEVALAERLRAIEAELDRLRTRLNWLLTLIVGAAVANVVLGLL